MCRLIGIAAASLVALIVAGCGDAGPRLGTVTGQVTMDGKPLPNVVVVFMPTGGGGTASGQTDASGNYELIYLDRKGAPIGQHKVAVTTVQKTKAPAAEVSSDSPEYQKMISSSAADYNVQWVDPIPAKYNAQTELTQEVKSGSNVINLELKSS